MSLAHMAELFNSGELYKLQGICLAAAVDAVSKKSVPKNVYRRYSLDYLENVGKRIDDTTFDTVLMRVFRPVGVNNISEVKFLKPTNEVDFLKIAENTKISGERVVLRIGPKQEHAIGLRWLSFLNEWRTLGMSPLFQDLDLGTIYREKMVYSERERGNVILLPPEK